jgi:hypothetical protein
VFFYKEDKNTENKKVYMYLAKKPNTVFQLQASFGLGKCDNFWGGRWSYK